MEAHTQTSLSCSSNLLLSSKICLSATWHTVNKTKEISMSQPFLFLFWRWTSCAFGHHLDCFYYLRCCVFIFETLCVCVMGLCAFWITIFSLEKVAWVLLQAHQENDCCFKRGWGELICLGHYESHPHFTFYITLCLDNNVAMEMIYMEIQVGWKSLSRNILYVMDRKRGV